MRTKIVDIDTRTAADVSYTGDAINVSEYPKGIIVCNITAFDTANANERLILEIEGSYDGSVWQHLRTFVDEENVGDVTTTTGDADRGKIEATGQHVLHIHDLPVFIRAKGTLSGTTPSVTYTMKGSFR